uniref:Uncharacterized protein n=1 Tax=Candidatus Kentrum sp. LFY TaxID=2126342 RepID=A0A450WV03_9GAMM|nr:MAG: hypothetical protein BECKLFY1418C_GA0070996_108018 [Candidatus Kentron sp. LFY]
MGVSLVSGSGVEEDAGEALPDMHAIDATMHSATEAATESCCRPWRLGPGREYHAGTQMPGMAETTREFS